ncbi:MAG: CocE/NonD family hydrolase [Anaerolineae bacterium]|nr:CocE/NonD family hydrolase [Anaerolineae bacterium]
MKLPISLPVADGVKLLKNARIPTRDGLHLAADIYLPDTFNPNYCFPVVMEYTPYRKNEINYAARPFYLRLPKHGYAVARVDIRGTGDSEGVSVDEYTRQEQLDGYDAVEWLAEQPWCDGHVNMMGISYGGFTALQVAAHNPPHLTSIIPIDFTDDRYTDDCHYRGGLMRLYYDIAYYGGLMIARNALPPFSEYSGDGWAEIWEEHLAGNEPYLLEWYRHQTDGPYWRNGSVADKPGKICCPVFLIGGWRDGYMNPPLRLYQTLTVPRKVLLGPWNHALPNIAIPGPRIDYLQEVLRWLDHWNKGINTGIMDEPPVTVYMQRYQTPDPNRIETRGEWRAEIDWPAPGNREINYFLSERHALGKSCPPVESADSFEYCPTVGISGGLWSGGLPFGLPGDQRPDEALALVYTTDPLEQELPILGWPRAVLHLASTASVIGFVVSLSDVAPDGVSHLVTKGMLNATRRNSFSDPQPLTPGEIVALEIPLDCTGWIFEKGHRIRLSIASADWPNVWPTPELATNHVYHGGVRPSRLILPTIPSEGSAAPAEFAPSPLHVHAPSQAVNPPTWRVHKDMLNGETSVELSIPARFRANAHTVVERDSTSIFHVDPRDPANASAQAKHIARLIRPGHTTQSQAEISVQATPTHFHLSISLEVRVNGTLHFTNHWVDTVPRELL